MKKGMLIIVITMLLLLCSCGKNGTKQESNNASYGNDQVSYDQVDIDVSSMKGALAYSQVYDLLTNPTRYEGKIIKIYGPLNVYYSVSTKKYYPTVIIQDATACCSQGLEFLLVGDPKYPEGYPKKDTNITVVGKFATYYEGTMRFCHLVDAVII